MLSWLSSLTLKVLAKLILLVQEVAELILLAKKRVDELTLFANFEVSRPSKMNHRAKSLARPCNVIPVTQMRTELRGNYEEDFIIWLWAVVMTGLKLVRACLGRAGLGQSRCSVLG